MSKEGERMKIVVLGGGISTERHVSLVTATSACKALRSLGHQAVFVDMFLGISDYNKPLEEVFLEPDGLCGNAAIEKTEPDLEAVKKQRGEGCRGRIGKNVLELCKLADCVFLGLHGADGEDGKIQATLELLNIPFTGSGSQASAIAMDKSIAKRIAESFGILTPEWQEYTYDETDIDRLTREIEVPCVVKIVNGGSSIGVELTDNKDELRKALGNMLAYGNHIVIEKKISGREITVPVLDGKALSPIEIIPPEGETFDYIAKYQSGKEGAAEICPAHLTSEEESLLRERAEHVHRSLGLRVYSRSDFILDAEGNVWFLEVNTLPGMTPNSLIPKAAAVAGLSYAELCERIVELSMAEKRE